jgi:hypothetical protein
MNDVSAAPDLTPPTKEKAPKAAKVPKAPKVVDPNAPPKVAKPRGNYGYHVDATIEVVKDKEVKYRGQRLDWFEIVKKYDGKKVKEFNEATSGRTNGKGTVQTPSGWLRFYVLDGSVRLTGQPVVEAALVTAAA